MSKRLGGIIGCKDKISSWHLIGFPDGSNIGSTVSCWGETTRKAPRPRRFRISLEDHHVVGSGAFPVLSVGTCIYKSPSHARTHAAGSTYFVNEEVH